MNTSAVIEIKDARNISIGSSRIPKLADRRSDELMIAVVGPVGSGCTKTIDILSRVLTKDYGYTARSYKLSQIIEESGPLIGKESSKGLAGSQRIAFLQELGNRLREKFKPDYLAAKVIEKIANFRSQEGFDYAEDKTEIAKQVRVVHFIDSIKNPAELRILRETYGNTFWLFGVFAPEEVRRKRLRDFQSAAAADLDAIIRADYKQNEDYEQSVRDTFYQADFFVRNDKDNDDELCGVLYRYLEILFGRPVHTPTREEAAMHSAYAEASSSACLSRQVGASILSSNGELIGVGRNDVPKYAGGLYMEEDDTSDHRCYRWGQKLCHNDKHKSALYEAIQTALREKGVINDQADAVIVKSTIAETDLRSIIEFSRAVHAEMEAIISVARAGKNSVVGATMYSTTYPCHSCARHVLASGIRKLVYIEPYPKSLAIQLHGDAISEKETDLDKKLVFLQFSGVSPRNVLRLFKTTTKRKDDQGKLSCFDARLAKPIVNSSLDDYATHEKLVVADLTHREQAHEQAEANQQPALPGLNNPEQQPTNQ